MKGSDFNRLLKSPDLELLQIQKETLGDKDFRSLQNIQRCINELISFARKGLGESTAQNIVEEVIVPIDHRETSEVERRTAIAFVRAHGFQVQSTPIKNVPPALLEGRDWQFYKFYRLKLPQRKGVR